MGGDDLMMPAALLDLTRHGQQDEYGYQSDKLATFLFQLRSELFGTSLQYSRGWRLLVNNNFFLWQTGATPWLLTLFPGGGSGC